LCETDDARPEAPTQIVRGTAPTEPRDVVRRQGAGPDEAHVAAQDVRELRQLVQARRPKPSTDACDFAVAHGTKFVDPEWPAVPSDTRLQEQDGAAVVEQNQERDHE
jgi:hypothetical protein